MIFVCMKPIFRLTDANISLKVKNYIPMKHIVEGQNDLRGLGEPTTSSEARGQRVLVR